MDTAPQTNALPSALADLAAIVEHLGIAYVSDRDGHMVAASTGYRELMALRSDVLLVPARHFPLSNAAMMAGQALEGLERIGRGIGARHLLVRHLPVKAPDGSIVGALGILSDTGAQLEDDAPSRDRRRLQDFIRASVDWVWETDRRGVLSFVSDRIVDVLGLPPVLLHGRALSSLGSMVAPAPGGLSLEAFMDARRPFRDVQLILADKEDKERRFMLHGVPAFDQAGNFTGFRGTATDISAQHEMASALAATRKQLDTARTDLASLNLRLDRALNSANRAARGKSEFLATMSHELRTPLNAVIGFADLIVGDEVPSDAQRYRDYAADIARAGHHLLRLIDDLLDTARIEDTQLRLEMADRQIKPIFLEARSIAQARWRGQEFEIAVDVVPDDLVATTDRTRLTQIVLNLLDNAVRVAPPGSTVTIRARAEGDNVAIDVVDRGAGIPPDRRGTIFEAFGRLEPSLIAKRSGGLGIGLSISRSLARLMDGDLSLLESGPNGSRFRLTLKRPSAPAAIC